VETEKKAGEQGDGGAKKSEVQREALLRRIDFVGKGERFGWRPIVFAKKSHKKMPKGGVTKKRLSTRTEKTPRGEREGCGAGRMGPQDTDSSEKRF